MPDLLILDEPLDGLDPLRRMEFLNRVLEEFSKKEGRSILISSHYLEELERIADRIAFIHEGELKRVVLMEQFKVEEKTIRVVFQKDPPEALLKLTGIFLSLPGMFALSRQFSIFYQMRAVDYFVYGQPIFPTLVAGLVLNGILLLIGQCVFTRKDF